MSTWMIAPTAEHGIASQPNSVPWVPVCVFVVVAGAVVGVAGGVGVGSELFARKRLRRDKTADAKLPRVKYG